AHLDGYERNRPIEERDNIEKAGCDLLSNDHRRVVIFRISVSLQVPVFDSSKDMALIGRTELKLDLVSAIGFGVLEQKVRTPGRPLTTLPVANIQFTEAKDGWIVSNAFLHPLLIQLWMIIEPKPFGLDELHQFDLFALF